MCMRGLLHDCMGGDRELVGGVGGEHIMQGGGGEIEDWVICGGGGGRQGGSLSGCSNGVHREGCGGRYRGVRGGRGSESEGLAVGFGIKGDATRDSGGDLLVI